MPDEKSQILIVEDEISLASIYKEWLEEKGFAVTIAESGEQGLIQIKKGGYNLILLDIMMPKMSGLEVLKSLKPEDKAKNGPIVMLSVLSQEEIIKQALQNGATGFIMKSYTDLEELAQRVRSYLQKEGTV